MSPATAKECFGDIETVFPEAESGLRESPPECLACEVKTDCLRTALATPKGAAVNPGGQRQGRTSARVLSGFKRWSRLKAARQRERS